jgi:hypothetical protein
MKVTLSFRTSLQTGAHEGSHRETGNLLICVNQIQLTTSLKAASDQIP